MATTDFFLSFNRTDRTTADLVYATITGEGFTCFYQHEDIAEGANFVQGMAEGLQKSATMLTLFSPAYFQSRYAMAELYAAFAADPLNTSGSILPLLVTEHSIPKPFNALVHIDCTNLDAAALRCKLVMALAPYRKATRTAADPRIPETNNAAAAQLLVNDLELAYEIFLAQCRVRDALVDAMCERDSSFELEEYEPFIVHHFAEMTPAERALHRQIRGYTDTIERLNRRATYYIEASKDFGQKIPRIRDLHEHLTAWLDKYDRTFENDPSIGVLYVGVLENKPFPVGIEGEIREYIDGFR